MLPYPAEEIECILIEEVVRADGTNKWYGPVTRVRITLLLLERLCGAWTKPGARIALQALGNVEQHLLYLCGTKDVAFSFSATAYDEMVAMLRDYREAISMVLATPEDWAKPGVVDSSENLENFLQGALELAAVRENEAQQAFASSGKAIIHTRIFIELHEFLSVAYVSFLTPSEHLAFIEQLNRALKYWAEGRALLFPPKGGLPQA